MTRLRLSGEEGTFGGASDGEVGGEGLGEDVG